MYFALRAVLAGHRLARANSSSFRDNMFDRILKLSEVALMSHKSISDSHQQMFVVNSKFKPQFLLSYI